MSALALEVLPDAATAAHRAGAALVAAARAALAERGTAALALSKAPPELLRALSPLDWERVALVQVDERVAPAGDPERNLSGLLAGLPAPARERVHPLPVEEADLERAAARYAVRLPRLDAVHLGLGEDGHTASLVPGDPVLEVGDRLVAATGRYAGRRRLTLTYPALEAAGELVWLVTGERKREALARLLERDESIPAARIANPRQLVVADAAAAG
ncbi:MAG TPA: 6-phosphogluconolactonase [Gaiellaceae bacterium]|nr:6-phosphogluconolactonase [Gaiellaceae bacterium]